MNATPLLTQIAQALNNAKLEAVLIGNAAAALQGAPVTTLDFDFLFRRTPAHLTKLKTFARTLGAIILRPDYPVSSLFRVVEETQGLQADFMGQIHGIRSFESLRSRAVCLELGQTRLWVASLGTCRKNRFRRPAAAFRSSFAEKYSA